MRGYILTVNIEKAFDTLNQSTLPVCLKKIGIGMILQVESKYYSKAKNFVLLIQKLQRHTLIWKKVRAKVIQFLLIFLFYVLKFCFYLLKLIIKYKAWTFTQLAGDTTFFLKNKNVFYFFSIFLFKTQLWKMCNCRNWSSEKCKNGSLSYEICWFIYWYHKNYGCILFI